MMKATRSHARVVLAVLAVSNTQPVIAIQQPYPTLTLTPRGYQVLVSRAAFSMYESRPQLQVEH